MLPLPRSPWLRVAAGAMALGIAFQVLQALTGVGGAGLASFSDNWVYTAVEFLAVAVSVARLIVNPRERVAWGLMTYGVIALTAGDLIWTLWLENLSNPPIPSIADAAYLSMYPAMYVSIMLLIRSELQHPSPSQWLDGAVVGLTFAALLAGVVMPTILADGTGHMLTDAVDFTYPVADLTLLAFVIVAFWLSGWRLDRMWTALGVGIAIMASADLVSAYRSAEGTYVPGGLLAASWPAAVSLIALAAWQRPRRRQFARVAAPHAIGITVLSAAAALAMLVYAAFAHLNGIAVTFAAVALVLSTVRGVITYNENVRILRRAADDLITDPLSGLRNRRKLLADLELAVADGEPHTLVFFDLNGFKRYNDTFGHAAGDALLARLGGQLRTSVGRAGCAYRLGGDEFCALFSGRLGRDDESISEAAAALGDSSPAFNVSTSFGLAVLPDDATSTGDVLRLADQRMYANKATRGREQVTLTRDVLLQLMNERAPDLVAHLHGVGRLSAELGRSLALDAEQIDELTRAAELHDIGKLAIPDAILEKPGSLNEEEWHFVRQHPVIGERILNVDPALRPVARLVRASHERWDGGGYPDGLAGIEIPLGARIIAVCDAYEAMRAGRRYRSPLDSAEAIAEFERSSGQFDPDVVSALAALIALRSLSPVA